MTLKNSLKNLPPTHAIKSDFPVQFLSYVQETFDISRYF